MFHIGMHRLTVNFTDEGLDIIRDKTGERVRFDVKEARELMIAMVMAQAAFKADPDL